MSGIFNGTETEVPSDIFPFGQNVDTLIVCVNKEQRTNVQKAYKRPAMYILPGAQIAGKQWDHIIIHVPAINDGAEYVKWDRWLKETILTRAKRGSTIHYV